MMNESGELNIEPSTGPAAVQNLQPKSKKSSGASKNNLKCKQTVGRDEAKRSFDDQNHSLTIMPSPKEETITSTADVAPILQERLNLSSDSGVNGINGLDLDSKSSTILNGSIGSPSHCDSSDINSTHLPVKPVEPIGNHLATSPSTPENTTDRSCSKHEEIEYVSYKSELQMPEIMRLIQKDLSEPYSIYTYRYFIHNWPKLCFLAMDGCECIGAIVCKLDIHRKVVKRGYIAMLAVDEKYRKKKIGSNLVLKAIRAMVADDADEVVLETEITNRPALRLYENLGFVRDKRLFRYYLNGVDALRLKLWLR